MTTHTQITDGAREAGRCRYIISDFRKDTKRTWYVVAPPGFYRRESDGAILRDGTCHKNSGPEWSQDRNKAFEFKSVRAAMRVRNKTISGKVHPIL